MWEPIISGIAEVLTGEVVKYATKQVREFWKDEHRREALQRCFTAGTTLLFARVAAEYPQHRAGIHAAFQGFFKEPIYPNFTTLLDCGSFEKVHLDNLEKHFRGVCDATTLPANFDFARCLHWFDYGFRQNALDEEILRDWLQTGNLLEQTRQQIAQTERLIGHTALLTQIRDSLNRLHETLTQHRIERLGVNTDGNIIARNVVGGDQITVIINPPAGAAPLVMQDIARCAYLDWIFERDGKLALDSIDPAAAADATKELRLEEIYTTLLTLSTDEHEQLVAGKERMEKRRALSAVHMLAREKHLALLGEPGGGKTTFLRHVSLCLAGEQLGRSEANLAVLCRPLKENEKEHEQESKELPRPQWNHRQMLPVAVVLRDFAAKRAESDGTLTLWQFIADDLSANDHGEFQDSLKKELQNPGGLILLDGLDEVPATSRDRARMLGAVKQFCDAFPNCRLLVTCRTYAYQKQAWQLPDFTPAILAPFNTDQIEYFVTHWYEHVARRQRLTPEARATNTQHLLTAIDHNEKLQELARRPILLTLMASLHAWRGGTLPDGREQLYAEVLPLLLDRWQRPRSVLHPTLTEYLKTDKQKLERTLQQLAFEAHHTQVTPQGTADIAEDKLAGALLRLCADCPEKPNPNDLKAYLEERADILTPHGTGVYSFPHRSFQEYLAAGHCCAQSDFPDNLATLARRQPDKWREVCLLAAARSAKGAQKMAWMMVDALFPENADWEPADLWGLRLAAQVIHESCKQLPGSADVPKLERVRRALPRLLASSLPALERAQAGDLLAALGDPRNGVLHLDAMEFCLVPSGPFCMGSSQDDKLAYPNEKPAFTNELDHDYWLALYPVSVAQFREYVTLSGANIGDKDCLAGIDNHPVVLVSWHEAMKFCEWLTARWQAAGCLPRNRRATLPSEAEWEKAARGGLEIPDSAIMRCVGALDGAEAPRMKNPLPERIYPWDNAANPNKANYYGTGIGTTSALGCFANGASAYGCEELSGNVLEWCRTEWQEGYRQYQNELPGKNRCVVRGGAFSGGPRFVRCAYRYGCVPDFRYIGLGFRVCVSPFLSTSGG